MKRLFSAVVLILSISHSAALASRGDVADVLATVQTVSLQSAKAADDYRVEVVRRMGSIVEIAVSCDVTVFYASYSISDRAYCDPKMRCTDSLPVLAKRYCH